MRLIDWRAHDAPTQEVSSSVESFKRADAWWANSVDSFNAGVLEAQLASDIRDQAKRERLLNSSAGALNRSIEVAPANAAAWTWLSYVHLLKAGPTRSGIEALRMSIELARFDPSLVILRCEIGLSVYGLLGEEDRKQLSDQLTIATNNPAVADLIRFARRNNSLRLVMQILLDNHQARAIEHLQELLQYDH